MPLLKHRNPLTVTAGKLNAGAEEIWLLWPDSFVRSSTVSGYQNQIAT